MAGPTQAPWTTSYAGVEARRQALLPFQQRRAELDDAIRSIDRGGDYGDAAGALRQRLENERMMLDIDQATMMPPHLTDSGQFEAGDVRSYLEDLGGGSSVSFDDLSPEQQFAYIRNNAPAYMQERAQEAAQRAGEAALPGAAGAAFGQVLGIGATSPWMGRTRARPRGPRNRCTTCHPQNAVPNEPYVTLYRGIQVRRGTPVQGHFGNSGSNGQMGSTDPRDALHYGINPPGNRPPAGADELVLIRVRVPRRLTYDPSPGPAPPPGSTEHLVIPREVDIRTLPGYREWRVPLREVAGRPDADRGFRQPYDPAVNYWSGRIRDTAPPGPGHNGGPPM